METKKRVEILNRLQCIEAVKGKTIWPIFEEYLSDENLKPGGYPVFLERQFEPGTDEYTKALLISCHFGAKSPDPDVSKYYLNRFKYVLKTLNA